MTDTKTPLESFTALSVAEAGALSVVIAKAMSCNGLVLYAQNVAATIPGHAGNMIGNAVLIQSHALRADFIIAIKDLTPEQKAIIDGILPLMQPSAPSAPVTG